MRQWRIRGTRAPRGPDPAGRDRRRRRGRDRGRHRRLRGRPLRRADEDGHDAGRRAEHDGGPGEGVARRSPPARTRSSSSRCVECHGMQGARRSRPGRAGAGHGRPEPHGRPAHAHHQPRPRRVGEPEAAVHAGLGRGPLEDAGLEPRRPTSAPACRRSPTRSPSRSRRVREPRSRARRSTSATAASTATARTASAACRTRTRRTSRSRRSRARASAHDFPTDKAIADVIRSGSVIGKAPIVSMPHWGGILSDQQIARADRVPEDAEVAPRRSRG